MLTLEKRIHSFASLGERLLEAADTPPETGPFREPDLLRESIRRAGEKNPWFTEDFTRHAFRALGEMLLPDRLERWAAHYDLKDEHPRSKTVGLVMAGNLPLVGFHDMLCVLLSGHRLLARTSSRDEVLPAAIRETLIGLDKEWEECFSLTGAALQGFDAVIATGSNNTSRYFDYYFGKYPHIIRKNRNSLALLTGHEEAGDLEKLADDVFLYFGLGCRNVSYLFLPEGYDHTALLEAFGKYRYIEDNHRYANNYSYQRALLQMNRVPHTDTGFALLREETALASPISVIHFRFYHSEKEVHDFVQEHEQEIQCRVGHATGWQAFGTTQSPALEDYADGIDTMEFLKKL